MFSKCSPCSAPKCALKLPFHHPRGVLGPFGPKVGNGVDNEFPGLQAPVSKNLNRPKKRVKNWKFQLFFKFFDSFSILFFAFWASGPGSSFSTPFPTLGPKGPRTPLWGLKGRKSLPLPKLHRLSHHICQTSNQISPRNFISFCRDGSPHSTASILAPRRKFMCLFWEVLNWVGVDGVGGIFPFFSVFFLRFSYVFAFFRFSPVLLGKEQTPIS